MPTFTYTGTSGTGKDVSGEIEASSMEKAEQILRSRRITDTKIRKKPAELRIPGLGAGKVPGEIITGFARQFATMIDAGLPLVQCLNILSNQSENETFKSALKQITGFVEAGSTLSEAMAKHPKIFNPLFVNMIAAGEVGGILDLVLLRLSSYLEKAEQLKRKIKGAMMYPIVVLIVAVGATLTLLIAVVPTFVNMFIQQGIELPLPTKIVIGISNFMKANFFLISAIIVAAVFLYKRYYATNNGEKVVDNLKLKMVLVGDLIRKSSIARFSRTLGTLLSSGVSILEALDITARTAGNRVIQDALLEARSSIGGGETITAPLVASEVFPPMVTQMINVGEQTGKLDMMLQKIADYYEEEVDAAVESLTSIIEPVIIVFLGVVIGGMVLAMYMPMFNIVG